MTAILLFLAPLDVARAEPNLFFSEYVEGSGQYNLALEIHNPTGNTVVFAQDPITIEIYSDGSSTPTSSFYYGETSGYSIAPGGVFVTAHFLADSALAQRADDLSFVFFDGNDAVVLRRSGQIVDVIGQIGFDPGTGWGSGEFSTADHTLRRSPSICEGDRDGSDGFDPALEWESFPIDTFDGVGEHTTSCSPSGVEGATWGSVKALYY